MTMLRGGAVAAAALLALGRTLPAQTVREVTASRPLGSAARVEARLEFHKGAVRVGPAPAGRLYTLEASYEPDGFAPFTSWNAPAGRLELALRGRRTFGIPLHPPTDPTHQSRVGLATEVDLDLQAILSAADGELELGDLRITSLHLEAGGSRSTVRFARANPGFCREARFSVEAGELVVEGFGNSGCRELDVRGRLGKILVDLTGALPGNIRAVVSATGGELVLRVPKDLGVRVVAERWLSRYQPAGLVREEGALVSPGYAEARRRLDLQLSTALASFTVEWVRGS